MTLIILKYHQLSYIPCEKTSWAVSILFFSARLTAIIKILLTGMNAQRWKSQLIKDNASLVLSVYDSVNHSSLSLVG